MRRDIRTWGAPTIPSGFAACRASAVFPASNSFLVEFESPCSSSQISCSHYLEERIGIKAAAKALAVFSRVGENTKSLTAKEVMGVAILDTKYI